MVFLWLRFSPSLTLNKIEHFSKASRPFFNGTEPGGESSTKSFCPAAGGAGGTKTFNLYTFLKICQHNFSTLIHHQDVIRHDTGGQVCHLTGSWPWVI
jgi:hypothetical protein